MTGPRSGLAFALMLFAALSADSGRVWLVLALIGIAGLLCLLDGLMGFAKGRKKDRLDATNIEAAKRK